MTGRDLVTASLRVLGVAAPGESIAAQEAVDGLAAINRMIASWSNERLFINAVVREVFPLVPGQAAYTMGVGGNFNTTRPQRIESALLQVTGTSPVIERTIDILNQDEYASIISKTLGSQIPICLYEEGTYPLDTLNLWPVPSTAYNLVLYSWKPITQITTLDTVLAYQPGFEEALIYNGALRLAPEYGKMPSQEVMGVASESKAAIKRMNTAPSYLRVDAALMQNPPNLNIYTGETR